MDHCRNRPRWPFNGTTTSTNDFIAEYAFDLVGNRLTKSVDKQANSSLDELFAYTYDNNDRLLQETYDDLTISGGVNTTTVYEYAGPAANGGTQNTKKTTWQGTDTSPSTGTKLAETTLEYDVQGRLKTATVDSNGSAAGGVSTASYEYNPDGIRGSQTIDGQKREYVIDANNPTGYAQVLEERRDRDSDGTIEPGELIKTYALGLDVIGQALLWDVPFTATGMKTHLYDGHGSVRALLTHVSSLLSIEGTKQLYAYDAYGNMLALPGYRPSPQTTLSSLLYSGEQTDRVTGLQYLRARYYNPTTGRFTSFDPFAGSFEDPLSLHKYLYTHDDPINRIDPTGEFWGLLLTTGFRLGMAGMSIYSAYETAQKVYNEGITSLNFWDIVTLLPGIGYFGGALKYAKSVNRFKNIALAETRIGASLYAAGKEVADLVGRARSTATAQLGTRVHRAFNESRLGRMLTEVKDYNSRFVRVTLGGPLAAGETGKGARPDVTIQFPALHFAIAIDLKPVPRDIFYKEGFIGSNIYLWNTYAAQRAGAISKLAAHGMVAAYFYIPYPSFV